MKNIDIENISTNHLLIFLFIFSLGLRLLYMNPGLFHFDSVLLAQAVEKTYETGSLHGQINGRYGSVIVNVLMYIPFHLITGIKSAEKSIIITDIFFASFSVLMLFLLLQKLFNNKVIPLFSAALFSVSPIFLSVTTFGKEHGIEIFFIFTSFFLLSIFHRKHSILSLVLSSISIAFSILVRESTIVYVPLYFLFYLNPQIHLHGDLISVDREVLKIKNIFLILGTFLAVFGVEMYLYLYGLIYRTFFQTGQEIVSFMGIYSKILPLAIQDLFFNLSMLGVFIAIVGAIIFYRLFENKFYFLFFLLWSATLFYFGNTSNYDARYLAIVSVPFFIFIAIAIDSLYKKEKILGLIIFIILITSLFLQIHSILEYRHEFSGEKEYALWLKDQVPPDSLIIAMDDFPFINYYANLKTKNHPVGDPKATKIWVEEIRSMLKNDTPIYIVESGFSYDPDGIFLKEIKQNFNLQIVGSHLIEDYHRASIRDNRYISHLYRILPK